MLWPTRRAVFVHPAGERSEVREPCRDGPIPVPTAGGLFHVQWDQDAKVSALGGLAFFAQFLETTGLFTRWVEGCPLPMGSNRSHRTRDVLGTALLSVLNGHWRYAHATALRGDQVNPRLLGMETVVSEDTLRRALGRLDAEAARSWQQEHLVAGLGSMLSRPWILDVDVTVKPLYGNQDGAELGYNPAKPARPSHNYHTYIMASTRLVLDVEVLPGDEHTSASTRPGLWHFLEKLPRTCWPGLLRGDCGFGNESMMAWPEMRQLPYLFKLRKTARVTELIASLADCDGWTDAGQGWQGREDTIRLSGWTRTRRIIVLRRARPGRRKRVRRRRRDPAQQRIPLDIMPVEDPAFEYAVLVTSLTDDITAIAQCYRDRADAENVFDELKNQWGWAGFTTRDRERCQITARLIAQVYNWWSIFVRMADPHRHHEAITSRPLLLHGIARQTDHGGARTITITHAHAKAPAVQRFFTTIAAFLRSLIPPNAEHWDQRPPLDRLIETIFAAAFRRGQSGIT